MMAPGLNFRQALPEIVFNQEDNLSFIKFVLAGSEASRAIFGALYFCKLQREESRHFSHFEHWVCSLENFKSSGRMAPFTGCGHVVSPFAMRWVRAAIAVQNARLFERGEIYVGEFEQRVKDLCETQEALRLSEEKFVQAFRSGQACCVLSK